MAFWLIQFRGNPTVKLKNNHFYYSLFFFLHRVEWGHAWMWPPDNLITLRVLSPQLTASPHARTVAPAADHIPVCVAQASRGPAVKRWPRNRCTSASEALWGVSSPAPTLFRKTRGGSQRDSPVTPAKSRLWDLWPPNHLSRLRKCLFIKSGRQVHISHL